MPLPMQPGCDFPDELPTYFGHKCVRDYLFHARVCTTCRSFSVESGVLNPFRSSAFLWLANILLLYIFFFFQRDVLLYLEGYAKMHDLYSIIKYFCPIPPPIAFV